MSDDNVTLEIQAKEDTRQIQISILKKPYHISNYRQNSVKTTSYEFHHFRYD